MNSEEHNENENEIVFFIDKQKYEAEVTCISAKELLSKYADEEPEETTLVLKDGKELTKYTDDNEVICLKNGMHFVIFHDGPTTVSYFGPDRLVNELEELGYKPEIITISGKNQYAILRNYEIHLGRFAGKIIDLGFLAMPKFPDSIGSSIHVRATPQLFEKTDSISEIRNITDSELGTEWRYWSINFNWKLQQQTAKRLMSQIAGVFNNA